MSAPHVLNPKLYRRLQRRFGHVRITGQGEAMIARPTRGFNDEPKLLIEHSGEYYKVCCAYCNDTRYRLEVSYMFGQLDGHGRQMTFLANCFNEACLSREDNWRDFVDKLSDGYLLQNLRVEKGREVPEEARVVSPPGYCRLLSALPARHKARLYVEGRGFDPDALAKLYGAGYCQESHYRAARDRLYIPVYAGKLLKGWQCRHLEELDWKTKDREKKKALPPKYFSCPGSHFRSQCIYSFDRMRHWQTGIIVEGPTDVWRFGAMSGCIFGNTMTSHQLRKFLAVFRNRSAVLLLDPEEYSKESTQRLVATLMSKMPGRFCSVKLPTGSDPGSLDRDFLRQYVQQRAARRGVQVVYERIDA